MRLSKPSRALFEAARGSGKPTSADRERVRRALAVRLAGAAGAVAGAAATSKAVASSGTAKALASLLSIKVLAPVALVVGVSAVGGVTLMRDPPPGEATALSPTAARVEVTRHAAARAPRASAATPPPEVASAAPAPVETARARDAGPDRAAAEVALIQRIHGALARGDAAEALRLVDEHGREFPGGALFEEREAARAIAQCLQGSDGAARVFLRARPRSPMAGRVRAVCKLDSITGPDRPGQ